MLSKIKTNKWYFISFAILCFINIIIYLIRIPFLNRLSFLITGIYSIGILYRVILYGARCCHIKFSKTDVRLLIGFISIVFVLYCILILSHNTIYVWDSTIHYENLMKLLKKFDHSNITGFVYMIKTSLVYDYGSLLLIFVYPFYFLTTKSMQMLNLSYFFSAVIPVIIVLYILGLYTIRKYKDTLKDNIKVKCTLLTVIVLFPLLHVATILGRPDIIGLVFVGLIILLTIDYDFSSCDLLRWFVIFVATITLVLLRRWYLYFVVAYYVSYTIMLVISSIKKKNMKSLRNVFAFGGISIIMVFILLKPLIHKIVSTSYSNLYVAFNHGGISFEIFNQMYYLGIILALMVIIGYIYALWDKKSRKNAIIIGLTYIISIILFTRVQNFEEHQSLILVPFYLYSLFTFIYLAYKNSNIFNHVLRYLIVLVLCLSFINCSCFSYLYNIPDKLLSVVDIYPYKRTDLKQIEQIVDYTHDITTSKDKVTVLAAGDDYDSAYFVHYPEPLSNYKTIYLNTYLVNEGFPINFFHSKYYLLLLPLQQWSGVEEEKILSNIVDLFLNDEYVSSKFTKIQTFPLKDDIVAIMYERIEPVDVAEIDIFIERFQYMKENYEDNFLKKMESYKKSIK